MKYPEYIPANEVHDFIVKKLVYKPLKKDFSDKNSYIYNLFKVCFDYPLWTYEPHEEERTQFSTWWHYLQRREYANPYIGDLYLLHELMHLKFCIENNSYIFKDFTTDKWAKQFIKNEILASIFSEVTIYGMYNGLRELTFNHTIYADSFTNQEKLDTDYMYRCRLETMVYGKYSHLEYEKSIHKYNDQNHLWCSIWKANALYIESNMNEFYKTNDIRIIGKIVDSHMRNFISFYGPTVMFNNEVKDGVKNLHKV